MAELFTVSVALGASNTGAFLENETTTGRYTIIFTRTGGDAAGLALPLTVFFTAAGTAVINTDFALVDDATGLVINNNSITISAGQNTASVRVAPLDDFQVEGTETVTISLAEPVRPAPGYVLDTTGANSLTLSITDNEIGPAVAQVSVVATLDTATEENNTAKGRFTFTRSNSPDVNQPLTVNFTVAGTSEAGTDYVNSIGQTITFAAEETSKTIDVTAIDDAILDNGETVVINITPSQTAQYTLGEATATVRIEDTDDRGPFSVIPVQELATEAGQDAEFTITRAADLGAVEVRFTLEGTAIASSPTELTPDYTVITLDRNGAEVVLTPEPNGSYRINFTSATGDLTDTERTILFRPIDDGEFEGTDNEDIVLTLQTDANSGYSIEAPIAGTASIVDNETEIAVTASGSPSEGGGNGIFTITRTSGDLSQSLVVNFSLGGSAVNSTDYQLLTNSVTILAGENTAQVVVAPIDDLQADPGENVLLTITPSSGYDITGATESLFIDDNEPTIAVTATTDTVVEGAESGVFTITRALGDTSKALTVNYTLTGTASNGDDYVELPGTATIAAGQTSVTINVATIDNTVFEGAETVTLTIDNSTSYIVSGTNASDTVTITDANDLLLETVRISATPSSVDENETNPANRSIFTITRDNANGFAEDLTVSYTISGSAVEGTDYNGLTGSVTIAATQASATIEIAPLDDLDVEGTESVTLTLTDPVQGPPRYVFNNTQSSATIAITDDDILPGSLPQVSVFRELRTNKLPVRRDNCNIPFGQCFRA